MKKLPSYILSLFTAILLSSALVHSGDDVHYYIQIPDGEIKEFYRWTPGRVPMVSAHRGGPMAGFPENAIETFENSTKYGPMVVEMDMALTSDGVIVLMHDKTLDRTTTCKGAMALISYADLMKCNLVDKDGTITTFKVPTLDDTLSWGRGKVVMSLDFKKSVPYERVVEAVRRAGAEDAVMLISYTLKQAIAMHKAGPELMLSVTIYNDDMLGAVKAADIPLDQVVAWVGTRLGTKAHYDALHALGMFVNIGTLGWPDKSLDGQIERSGDDSKYLDIVALGADIIATDRTRAVASLINNPHIFYFIPSKADNKVKH